MKFKSFKEIANENDFDFVFLEEDKQYSYCSTNRQFNMKWFTKNSNVRNTIPQPACNIVERPIDSLGTVKNVTRPIKAWVLFVKDGFLEKICQQHK